MTLYGVELIRLADEEEVASFLADELVAAARAGSDIVRTGGESPGRAYELAAEREPDWSGAALWWGDERAVPPDDERSNFGMSRQRLLDGLSDRPREVHRIEGELGAAAAADRYDAELEGAQLDLVLLGIGPDGHAASLFPSQPTLEERSRRAIAAEARLEPFVDRVTMTLPTIRAARRIVFLVTGDDKADAVARAFAGPVTEAVPASLARRAPTPVEVFLDPAAGSKLSST
jgi:6-phosphogluconolactonase